MTNAPSTTLVLGGTGKIGSRLAVKLAKLGLDVRTAAPKGAGTEFDWNDATTHPAAVEGVERQYVLPPLMRMDFAPPVATFLDLAEASGVRHVTYLSEYGTRQFPPDSAPRAVERDLTGRGNITHSRERMCLIWGTAPADHLGVDVRMIIRRAVPVYASSLFEVARRHLGAAGAAPGGRVPASLREALGARLTNPSKPRGIRHSLGSLVSVLVAGVACG